MCALIQKPFGTLDAAMAHFDQYEAWATSIQRTDVEAWRDERNQLRAALRAVLAAAVVQDWTMRGAPHYCVVCDAPENDDGDVVHADDCPVAADRALLEARA